MKKLSVIISLLLLVAVLFTQCKSSECTYKPKAAKNNNVWMKR